MNILTNKMIRQEHAARDEMSHAAVLGNSPTYRPRAFAHVAGDTPVSPIYDIYGSNTRNAKVCVISGDMKPEDFLNVANSGALMMDSKRTATTTPNRPGMLSRPGANAPALRR